MSALQKLRAYFGMVPAEDVDGYDDYQGGYDADPDGYDGYAQPVRRLGSRSGYQADLGDEVDDYQPEHRGGARRGWAADAPVHGALAVEPQRDPITRPRPDAAETGRRATKIITLQPRSFNEARTIGEHYREETPVIINLTGMDDADARRLVDFAAGLAFALRGSIDRITTKVFLLSPPNVDVTAEDRRRIAEGGFFGQG